MGQAPYTPDPHVRLALIKEGVKIFTPDEISRKHTKTLKATEGYYEKYLEMLVGTQIWDILDALSAVEYELYSRKKKRVKDDGTDD